MRTIKFRIWDKKNNKFWHEISGMVNSGIIINANGIPGITYEKTRFTFFEPEFLIVQQFTGLKDKNGQEIFEGDILSNDHPSSPYEVKYGERSIVTGTTSDSYNIYEKTIGYYLFRPKDKRVFDFLPTNMEIIGNIYENPELLK